MAGVHNILAGSGGGAFVFTQTISSSVNNYNLRNAAIAAGWNQVSPLLATVNISSGVYVSAGSTSQHAFDRSGSFPTGSSLNLVNNGFIIGMGGAGGNGSFSSAVDTAGQAGFAGGPAISAGLVSTITNNGTIAGGGGGGGGGQGVSGVYSDGETNTITYHRAGGGGGGRGGIPTSNGGLVAGSQGTSTAAGTGGPRQSAWNGTFLQPNCTGAGGAGGGWGQAGSAGTTAAFAPWDLGPGPYSGGAAGAAVNGDSNITWQLLGDVRGARNP